MFSLGAPYSICQRLNDKLDINKNSYEKVLSNWEVLFGVVDPVYI